MKVQSRIIFSVREWRSSAESLLSSDMMLNFPPEQFFWIFIWLHKRDKIVEKDGRTRYVFWASVWSFVPYRNLGGTAVYSSLVGVFLQGIFYFIGNCAIVNPDWERWRLFFYAQGHVRKLAALLHVPRAASSGEGRSPTLKIFCPHFYPIFRWFYMLLRVFFLWFFCLHDFLVPF